MYSSDNRLITMLLPVRKNIQDGCKGKHSIEGLCHTIVIPNPQYPVILRSNINKHCFMHEQYLWVIAFGFFFWSSIYKHFLGNCLGKICVDLI